MQSSVVSSPNLKGGCFLRDFSVPSAPAHSFLSLACNGTLNLVAFAFRTQASIVIVTHASSSHLRPRLGLTLSINIWYDSVHGANLPVVTWTPEIAQHSRTHSNRVFELPRYVTEIYIKYQGKYGKYPQNG